MEASGCPPLSPKVSIIVPTFNQGHFLREAINSVLAQTLPGWELIIVDNFSIDSTSEIVSSFADSRIRYKRFRNHGVIGRSRNFGVSLARAPVIAFLDSDDTWAPEKLESCISVLNNESADIVCHSETWRGPNDQSRLVHYGPTNRSTFKNLVLRGNCLSTSATLMSKKKFLDVAGFREDEQINTAEDYDLWIRLAQAGANFTFLRKNLGVWRVHEAGSSRSLIASRVAAYRVFATYVKVVTKNIRFWRIMRVLKFAGSVVRERFLFMKV